FRHRNAIAQLAGSHQLRREQPLRVLAWLIPVLAVGALTFLVPSTAATPGLVDSAFLAASTAIAIIVFAVSRDIAVFLRDTGLLFDEFFRRISGLVIPAFAFLTFYSLLVILFASLYA